MVGLEEGRRERLLAKGFGEARAAAVVRLVEILRERKYAYRPEVT